MDMSDVCSLVCLGTFKVSTGMSAEDTLHWSPVINLTLEGPYSVWNQVPKDQPDYGFGVLM